MKCPNCGHSDGFSIDPLGNFATCPECDHMDQRRAFREKGGSVRDAFHEAVQALLKKPDEELVRVWNDDEEGEPEFCVSVRREDDAWRGVFCLMPPAPRVMWIDRQELEAIVAAEKARMMEGSA